MRIPENADLYEKETQNDFIQPCAKSRSLVCRIDVFALISPTTDCGFIQMQESVTIC